MQVWNQPNFYSDTRNAYLIRNVRGKCWARQLFGDQVNCECKKYPAKCNYW